MWSSTLLLLACALLWPAPARAAADLKPLLVGQMAKFTLADGVRPAPTASFRDGSGTEIDLGKFRGQVVLVNLWATWCIPCREEMPALDRLQAAKGGPDFQVVAISQDRAGPAKAQAFLAEIGVQALPFYIDATMRSGRAFGAYGLPLTILYDRQGQEVGRLFGIAEWDGPEAVALISAVGTRR
jgi:thiol-disulfide isomerase/thioredoxin